MTISVTPGSGKSIASDLIGTGTAPTTGQDVGYVKIDQGATGSSSPVKQGNGLYIQDDYQAPVNLTINSSTSVNSAVTVATAGYDTVTVSHIISGTVTGGNTAFEVYDGTSWIAIKGGLISSYGTATNYNLNGGSNCYQFNVAGFPQFRARLTSALVGSGSVNVAVIVSSSPDVPLMTVGLDPAATVPLPSGAAQETGNLATIATAQGAGGTGISQPTGGSGLLGWLSGIYKAITGTLTVSGSVTANAGTNLNTSALAVETGGNLASINSTTGTTSDTAYTSGNGTIVSVLKGVFGYLGTLAGAVSSSKVQVYQPGTTPTAGTVSATTTAAALTSTACSAISVQNDPLSTNNLQIGTASGTQPYKLLPGQSITITCSNANQIYVSTASGTATVNYLVVS